jgi:RNA polymerase sigma-70 factor (ECF subfamily)
MRADGVEDLFRSEYERLVRSLGLAFDPESASDAVQDAFIEADTRWERVSTLDDPAGWIRRVAVNRLLTGRRNHRRRREIIATLQVHEAPDLTDRLVDLRAGLTQLPEQMRVVTCLFYLADLTIDQVADALGVAPGTVKSTLHEARKRLTESMEVAP